MKNQPRNHRYVNLSNTLVELVETCVTTIFEKGERLYSGKKDFITQATEQLIEKERRDYPELDKLIKRYYKEKQTEVKIK